MMLEYRPGAGKDINVQLRTYLPHVNALPPPFFHQDSRCESDKVGAGTKIWAFSHVLPGAVIGSSCNICDHVFIEGDVIIGDRVTIKCGVQLWNGLRLGNDVFIGPNATFCNDALPRSKQPPQKFLKTIVEDGASIGANATILPGLTIGTGSMVGAGAVVTSDVRPHTIVKGNPARITGYMDTMRPQEPEAPTRSAPAESWDSLVKDVRLIRFPFIADQRGDLTVGNFGEEIPFQPARYYFIFNTGSKDVRGEYAHRECHQLFIAARGSCMVMVDDGRNRQEYRLDSPTTGLYIPPMIWTVQFKHSQDCFLSVFASHPYEPSDYIRDYSEFVNSASKTV